MKHHNVHHLLCSQCGEGLGYGLGASLGNGLGASLNGQGVNWGKVGNSIKHVMTPRNIAKVAIPVAAGAAFGPAGAILGTLGTQAALGAGVKKRRGRPPKGGKITAKDLVNKIVKGTKNEFNHIKSQATDTFNNLKGEATDAYHNYDLNQLVPSGTGIRKRKGRFAKGSPEALEWGRRMRASKGDPSKTHHGELDYTTKKSSQYFHRNGHLVAGDPYAF